MPNVRLAAVVLTTMLLSVVGIARALECGGRLVSIGNSPWEVQAICGGPTEIDDSVEVILKPAYDLNGQVAGHVPIAVPKSVWTYNFGTNRLVYVLTFLEGKLVKMETGGYGH